MRLNLPFGNTFGMSQTYGGYPQQGQAFFNIELKGNLSSASLRLFSFDKEIYDAAWRAVKQTVIEMRKQMRTSLTRGKTRTGRLYTWIVDTSIGYDGGQMLDQWVGPFANNDTALPGFKRARAHRASGPGEVPKSDTKNLWKACEWWASKPTGVAIVGVTNKAHYAKYLEFGAPGNRLKPRPFLAPVVRDQIPNKLFARMMMQLSNTIPKDLPKNYNPPVNW